MRLSAQRRAFSCLSDLAGGPHVSETAMRHGICKKSIELECKAKVLNVVTTGLGSSNTVLRLALGDVKGGFQFHNCT